MCECCDFIIKKKSEDLRKYYETILRLRDLSAYDDKQTISSLREEIKNLKLEIARLQRSNSELYWKVNTWKKIVKRYRSHWAVKLFIGKKYETN